MNVTHIYLYICICAMFYMYIYTYIHIEREQADILEMLRYMDIDDNRKIDFYEICSYFKIVKFSFNIFIRKRLKKSLQI